MDLAPHNLLCDLMVNPLGIEQRLPKFSWRLPVVDRRGACQTAYEVHAATTESLLRQEKPDLWNTSRVESDQNTHVLYGGKPLKSRQRVFWRVRTWDEEGAASKWSDTAWFELGLAQKDLKAEWIGSPTLVGGKKTGARAPYVRKTLVLPCKPHRARLYVTSLGANEMFINGTKVGDVVFAPGWTDFRKRIQVHTFDVTDMLEQGENVLAGLLGDGWGVGNIAWVGRQHYFDRPYLLAQLEWEGPNGQKGVFKTDANWLTAPSHILENDLYMGESVDARLEIPGWNSDPRLDTKTWTKVQVREETPKGKLVGISGPPVRRIMELHPIAEPKEMHQWPKSKWLFDLGQNMVGRVRIKVNEPAGTTLTLKFAEVLKPDGHIYTDNLRAARCTDVYTCKGVPDETWEPMFTFHGFRYVELDGVSKPPTKDTIVGVVLHSDTPKTGTFECSDPLLNQLQHNIEWGQRGNFLEAPTDCPQRDERLGWTGDAQVFVKTATFNMNVAPFFAKWLTDMADAQGEKGEIPSVVPNLDGMGADGGPAWADAAVICPWTIYERYGDVRVLETSYPMVEKFLDWLGETSRDGIRAYEGGPAWGGYGDWLNINAETPKDLIGTAMFAYSAKLASKISAALGKQAKSRHYARVYERVKMAFQREFVTPEGRVIGETQTGWVLALHFDLLKPEHRPRAVEMLVADIQKRGVRLSTGFVGSSYLPWVLSDNGRWDIAFELLMQKQWPSWLYAVTQGATTIWERWDGWTHDKGFQDPGMNSFNHYAYGAIGAWLYGAVAGLDIEPGARRLLLKPRPGAGLTYAKAALETPSGTAKCGWKIESEKLILEIVVPPNMTAVLNLPEGASDPIDQGKKLASDGDAYHLVSGNYEITCKYVP